MVVDSSALAEQVVADVMSSAFDWAGQRCSACACSACRTTSPTACSTMLKGAMAELEVGDPRRLSVDVGPVITAEARDAITAHIETMRAAGTRVTQAAARPKPPRTARSSRRP